MRKYLTVFKINWQSSLHYRGPTLLYIFGNVLYIVVLLYLWNAIYQDRDQLGNYSLQDLFTYYILQLMINSLVLSYVSWDIIDQIREGFFSNFLVKPVNYFHYWFTINLSGKLLEGLFILGVTGVMGLVLFPLIQLPDHGATLFYFAVSLVLGFILAFQFDFCIGLIAFWLIQVKAFKYMLQYIVFFFAGALLPLDLFPQFLQTISQMLPFQYLIFIPIQIFLEKEPAPFTGFLIALLWIVLLQAILWFGLRKGIQKYEAVGQ